MAVVVTKEHITNARLYLNIGAKMRLAEQIAGWCVQPVEGTADDVYMTPPIYKENRAIKNLLMMGILCRYYLQIEFEYQSINLMENGVKVGEQPIDFYPTMEAFDDLASSNIVNQIERLKKTDKELSNIIYDMMYDYKALEQMVNSEIKDYVAQKNDTVTRLFMAFERQMSEENLKSMTDNLESIKKELETVKVKG